MLLILLIEFPGEEKMYFLRVIKGGIILFCGWGLFRAADELTDYSRENLSGL